MKKNWAIVFGVLLIIKGVGTITTDFRSGAFDIASGAVFTALWILCRKIASDKKSTEKHESIRHIPSAKQTGVASQPTIEVAPKPTVQTAPQSAAQTVPQPAIQPTPSSYKFSIEISGFKEEDEESQNLDFYREKLNSKKALTSFDTYVVLDCETSGLSPKSDEIIEIALMKYVKGELAETFSSLVSPSRPISSRITEITGITNADLENAPKIQDVMPKVWNFIDGFVLVGHNSPFDIGFLKKQFAKSGYEGRFNYVDTLQLARAAFPDFPNHKLSTCIEKLSLRDEQTHRAMDDVVCTQLLLEKCLPILLEQKERELAERRARKGAAVRKQSNS